MRIRKSIFLSFILCSILAAYLGFASISVKHDKLLHFGMFFILSFLFYWILESKSLRIVRNSTFVVCTLIGGIGSEFAQHFLTTNRVFDWWDIAANVCGSLIAIVGANLLHVYLLERAKDKRRSRFVNGSVDLESRMGMLYEVAHLDEDDDEEEEMSTGDDIPLFAMSKKEVNENESK